MAPMVLYYHLPSGPCRMALSAIRCLGLDVELRIIDLFSKEQLKEEFVKINPRHTLPTLDDNGFILTESRAIAIYLVEKYFPDGHSLYPKDIKQRARIHELLLFDSSTLYPPIRTIINSTIYVNAATISDIHRQNLFQVLELLNTFLKGNKYVTGSEEPTLADAIIFVSITNVVELGGDITKFTDIAAWFKRCKQLPSAADNFAGAKMMGDHFRSISQDTI